MLSGGNDGLNTIVPLKQFGVYTDLRKPAVTPLDQAMALNIPLAALEATAFDDNYKSSASVATTYAMHPRMSALRALYARGKVAVIAGIGIPPEDTNRLSHQTGSFDWQTGTINKSGLTTTGWLGLTLDLNPGGLLPAMVALNGEAPLLMLGTRNGPLVLSPPLEGFELLYSTGNYTGVVAELAQFSRVSSSSSGTAAGEFVRAESQSATELAGVVRSIASKEPVNDYPLPQTALGQQLQQIARVILSESGVAAYYAVQGSYDTHSQQQSYQPALLEDLSESISTFYSYLASKGASRNLVIMTVSDFGRRAAANSSLGSDHGTSSVTFVIGDQVKGGVYGSYPSLANLDADGNMIVELDFRSQISDAILFLGGDPTSILGKTYPKIGFI